jgi:predicted CXXCH cytochrome family protein
MSRKVITVAVVFLAALAVATLLYVRVPFLRADKSSRFSPAERAEGEQLFAEKVKPILNRKCSKCHGEDDSRSRLRVDSREALLCGGKRGPAIALGNPDDSLLIQSVRQTGDLKMPRRGKLTPEEVQALTDWIKDGAPWPERTDRGWRDQIVTVVDCVL